MGHLVKVVTVAVSILPGYNSNLEDIMSCYIAEQADVNMLGRLVRWRLP